MLLMCSFCFCAVWRAGAASGRSECRVHEESDDRAGVGESVQDEPGQEPLPQPVHQPLPYHPWCVLAVPLSYLTALGFLFQFPRRPWNVELEVLYEDILLV